MLFWNLFIEIEFLKLKFHIEIKSLELDLLHQNQFPYTRDVSFLNNLETLLTN